MQSFSPKDPLGVVPLEFDFTDDLQGQIISTVTVYVDVEVGVDGSASAILLGSPTIVGDKVRQVVTGGVDGVTYLVRAVVVTDAGLHYPKGALLPIVKSGLW